MLVATARAGYSQAQKSEEAGSVPEHAEHLMMHAG